MRTTSLRAAAGKAAALLLSLACAAGAGAIAAGTANAAGYDPSLPNEYNCNGTIYYSSCPASAAPTPPSGKVFSSWSCSYSHTMEGGYNFYYCSPVWKDAYVPPTYYYASLYYNANGGTGAPSSQSSTSTSSYGSATFTISNSKPTRDGYKFLGWNTSQTAASAAYQPGATISVSYNSSRTLYAVWEKSKPADTTKPVITGANDVAITVGGQFDPKSGITASDDTDGDLTANIKITGSVDVTKPGSYELTYSVADAAGNKTEVKRTITVTPVMSANMPETGVLAAPLVLMGAFLPLGLAGISAGEAKQAKEN